MPIQDHAVGDKSVVDNLTAPRLAIVPGGRFDFAAQDTNVIIIEQSLVSESTAQSLSIVSNSQSMPQDLRVIQMEPAYITQEMLGMNMNQGKRFSFSDEMEDEQPCDKEFGLFQFEEEAFEDARSL